MRRQLPLARAPFARSIACADGESLPCYAVICAIDHSYILQHDFGVCHDNPSFLSKMKIDRQNRPVVDAFVCRFINHVPIINLRCSSVNMFSYICYFDTKTYGSKCARAQHSH